jgi:hypothetical protein
VISDYVILFNSEVREDEIEEKNYGVICVKKNGK